MPAMLAPTTRASNWVAFVRLLADGAAWAVADMSPPVRGGRHLDAGQQGSSTPSDVWPRRLRPAAPARSAGGMIERGVALPARAAGGGAASLRGRARRRP